MTIIYNSQVVPSGTVDIGTIAKNSMVRDHQGSGQISSIDEIINSEIYIISTYNLEER